MKIKNKKKRQKPKQNIKIAVIDSGAPNKDIFEQQKAYFISNHRVYTKKRYIKDEQGHSTVINNILEKYVKEKEDIINIKIFTKDLTGNIFSLISALDFCYIERVKIVNLSLGFTNDSRFEIIEKYIAKLRKKNIIVIAAHHNDNYELAYPAGLESVIGVRTHHGKTWEFDYINKNIKCGIKQELEWIDGNKFNSETTSFLVPHIVGMTYGIIKKYKTASVDRIMRILEKEYVERAKYNEFI